MANVSLTFQCTFSQISELRTDWANCARSSPQLSAARALTGCCPSLTRHLSTMHFITSAHLHCSSTPQINTVASSRPRVSSIAPAFRHVSTENPHLLTMPWSTPSSNTWQAQPRSTAQHGSRCTPGLCIPECMSAADRGSAPAITQPFRRARGCDCSHPAAPHLQPCSRHVRPPLRIPPPSES